MACAEVTCCKAQADSKGKPITPPRATRNSGNSCCRDGRFSFNHLSATKASIPAITARPAVRNKGFISFTAILVAGSDPLKISTPINPFSQPPEPCAGVFDPFIFFH